MVDETLLCPDSKVYYLRSTTEYYETSETLRDDFAALSDTGQAQTVTLTDQLKAAKAAIATRHNRIFLHARL